MLEIFTKLMCTSGVLLHIVRYRCAKTKRWTYWLADFWAQIV